MLKKISVLLICLAYVTLLGCGTKGPLYIPEQRYPQKASEQSLKSLLGQANHSDIFQKPIVINPS